MLRYVKIPESRYIASGIVITNFIFLKEIKNIFMKRIFRAFYFIFLIFLGNTDLLQAQTVIDTWANLSSPDAQPIAVVVDNSGNIYTANQASKSISKITTSGTVTQTWATLTAIPNAMVIDASGNIYTANNNNIVSKVTPTGTVTQTWATLGSGFMPTAMVIQKSSGIIYVTGNGNAVSQITTSGTVFQTWGLASDAYPTSITIDGSSNIYTGNNNSTISKITYSSGTVTQAWATVLGGIHIKGIAADGANVYTINNNGTLSRTTFGGNIGTWFTLPAGGIGNAIVLDAASNLYVASSNWYIYKIDPGGPSTLGGWYLGTAPFSIALDASNNIYTANFGNSTVSKITSSGTVTSPWATILFPAKPWCIVTDASGNVYTGNGSKSISKITSSGTTTINWATLANGLSCMVIDGLGNIYTGNSNNTISKITSSGVVIPSWAILANNATIMSLCVDALGNIYAINSGNKTVNKLNATDGSIIWTATLLGSPQGGVIDASNNIYVTNDNNSISKISSSGIVTQAWATLASDAYPYAIAIDALGNIYTGNSNGTISKITSSGVVTQSWAVVAAANTFLSGIVIDASNNLYVSDYDHNKVIKISTSSAVTQNWATISSGGSMAAGAWPIAIDALGNIYTANYGNSTVSKIINSTLPLTFVSFTAKQQNSIVTLNWLTSNEINTSYFNIQRSVNNTEFFNIDKINAIGNSSNTYKYEDNIGNVNAQVIYYRLQSVDKDGSNIYSKSVSVAFNNKNSFSIYPNPARNIVYVNGTDLLEIKIIDHAGRVVVAKQLNNISNTAIINIANLTKGLYMVQIKDRKGNAQIEKLVVE